MDQSAAWLGQAVPLGGRCLMKVEISLFQVDNFWNSEPNFEMNHVFFGMVFWILLFFHLHIIIVIIIKATFTNSWGKYLAP